MLITIGADHGGFEYKETLRAWLADVELAGQQAKLEIRDCGAFELNPEDDYPVFATALAKDLLAAQAEGKPAFGILLCRSGAGMAMAANRFSAIRAAVVTTEEQAVHARAHNNANVIVLSGDWLDLDQMKACILKFVTTQFGSEERHIRRIAQLGALGQHQVGQQHVEQIPMEELPPVV
jgi:ribose 5-phosphate isomerase B